MEKYLDVLSNVSLFHKIDPAQISTMLHCLGAVKKCYQKNSSIISMEDEIQGVGIVLSGSVQIIKEDYKGNSTILTSLGEGDIFLETFACAGVVKSPVRAYAVSDCDILFVKYQKIIHTCTSSCIFHSTLIENMLFEIANKNISLSSKMEIISKRTIRDKILTYLETCCENQCKVEFEIPFTRNELADYLCVDRSALSRELSKMRDDGMIEFHKNRFELK